MKHRQKLPGKSACRVFIGIVSLLFISLSFSISYAQNSAATKDQARPANSAEQNNRNFQQLHSTGKSRVPDQPASWTDMNTHDSGITVLEMKGPASVGDGSSSHRLPATVQQLPTQYQTGSRIKAKSHEK